jgi:hypothetical protein
VLSQLIIPIGVYGGITVISVELLGAFCETTFSLSPGLWILVGGLILLVLLLVGLMISFSSDILGILFNYFDVDLGFFAKLLTSQKDEVGKDLFHSAAPTRVRRAFTIIPDV